MQEEQPDGGMEWRERLLGLGYAGDSTPPVIRPGAGSHLLLALQLLDDVPEERGGSTSATAACDRSLSCTDGTHFPYMSIDFLTELRACREAAAARTHAEATRMHLGSRGRPHLLPAAELVDGDLLVLVLLVVLEEAADLLEPVLGQLADVVEVLVLRIIGVHRAAKVEGGTRASTRRSRHAA